MPLDKCLGACYIICIINLGANMKTKKCTRCGEEKPMTLEFYYKNPKGKYGFGSRCKVCCKLQVAEKWAKNPEYFIEWSANKRKKIGTEEDNKRANQSRLKAKEKGISCVYTITNTITGKIYVGETTWKHRRFLHHKLHLKNNKHENRRLQEDFNKFGEEAFEYSVVKELSNDKKLLRQEEKIYIKKLIAEGKKLYNINLNT